MKQSVFKRIKEFLQIRYQIIKASTIYTFQQDTAYVAENWAGVISTIFYTFSFVLFIKILYSNIDSLAGYSENEMMLFLWTSQLSFYLQVFFFENNVIAIDRYVNSGELDLILSKPLPSLFYISLKRISLVWLFRDAFPAMFLLSFLISWGELSVTTTSFVSSLIIFALGLFLNYCLTLFSVLPVFWIGSSMEIYHLSSRLQWLSRREVPYEAFPTKLKMLLSSFIPVLITTGLTVSVALNKTDAILMLLFTIFVAMVFAIFLKFFWRSALRAYSSASS